MKLGTTQHAYVFFTNLHGDVLHADVFAMPDRSYQPYMEALATKILQVMGHWGIPREKVLAAGLSISGITDWSHQVVDNSVEMGWNDAPLGLDLRWRLGLSSFVDMDVRIVARTQIHPTNPRNAVGVLFANRGIGLSLIVNNEVYRGYSNRAGENRFFYPSVFAMERFIETEPVIQQVIKQPYFGCPGQEVVRAKLNHEFQLSLESSRDAREAVETFAKESAQLMYSLTSLINPRTLVLTGGIFDYVDTIFASTRANIDSFGRLHHRPEVQRGSDIDHLLERGITTFVLEKFHALKQFDIV